MQIRLVLAITGFVALAGSGIAAAQSQDGRYGDDRRDNQQGGWRDDPRGGPGRSQAIVYADDKFHGRSMTLDRPIRSLRDIDMNDKVSSIEIRGGPWLVCADDDFQGRCVTLDHSIRKLTDIGMDDKISSMRPIRNDDRDRGR